MAGLNACMYWSQYKYTCSSAIAKPNVQVSNRTIYVLVRTLTFSNYQLQVIYHICECLVDLHASGYVHRDLKPGNIMWLPSQNRWTLIDFGCVAAIGYEAGMGFSLMYAAPEVVRARYREQRSSVVVDPAIDAWSMGVLALELFSSKPALRMIDGEDKARVSLCVWCVVWGGQRRHQLLVLFPHTQGKS